MMMMMMKNPVTLMTCSLLFLSLAVPAYQGRFGPDECCFQFISTKLPRNRVVSYKFTDERCSMKGVSFTMKNGAKICADPSEPWVESLIKAKERLRSYRAK
ncbi:C-C motif chemokine 4-like [Cyclopterus lumpus]|uniref:Chemokine interleukin-8-like domain-containing protein n=1 Tax=Cyclopterus lumpus TaxID=8103 RepID=A0A8C3AVT2_CYCLU|nr:C-C motif chemokine 4-like [Cyclopterus lumpus]